MATSLQTIRRLTIEGRTTGVKEATDQLSALSRAQTSVSKTADGMATSTDTSSKRQLSAARSYDAVRAKVDEAYRSQLQYQRMQGVVDKAFNQGAISQTEYAKTSAMVAQRFNLVSKAANDNAKAIGLARHEMINLGRQAQDVGVSLIGGQAPLTVLAQQGTQIFDIFSSSNGSLKGFGQQIAGIITPTRVLTLGLGLLGVAAYAAYSSWKTFAKQLDDTSRIAGTTAQEMSKLQAAASFKGIDQTEFSQAVAGMSRQIYEARTGAGELAQLFRVNGVQAKGFTEYLEKGADLIKNAASDQQRLNLLQQMGLPPTMQWVRFMSQGSDGIRKATADMAGLNAQSDAMLAKQRELDEAWNKFWTTAGQKFRNLFVEVVSGVQSVVSELGKGFAHVGGVAASFNDRFHFPGATKVEVNKPAGKTTVDPAELQRLNSLEQQRLGILSQMLTVGQQVRQVELQIAAARMQGVSVSKSEEDNLKRLASERALGIDQIKAYRDQLEVEAKIYGMSAGEAYAYQVVQEKINEAKRNGVPLTEQSIARLREEAAITGKIYEVNKDLKEARDNMRGFGEDFLQAFLRGENAIKSATGALANLMQRMASQNMQRMMSGGSLFGNQSLMSGQGAVGMAGAAAGGYQSGSWASGMLGGALAGASFGPIGALIGGGLGALGGLFGGNSQRRQQEQQRRQEELQRQYDAEERAWRLKDRQEQLKDRQDMDGALRQFDRDAAWQRLQESKAGNQNIVQLEATLALERQAIVDEWGQRAVEAERARQEELWQLELSRYNLTLDIQRDLNEVSGKGYFNEFIDLIAMFDQRSREAVANGADISMLPILFQRRAQQIVDQAGVTGAAFQELIALFPQLQGAVTEFTGAAEEEAKRLQEEAKRAAEEFHNFLSGLSRNIREFIDGFRGGADTNLSPLARRNAALSSAQSQYGLALGGDREAANGITQYVQRLIEAQRAYGGSSSDTQALINEWLTKLEALPGQISSEQYIVDAIVDMKSVVTAAIQSNSPELIANALSGYFNNLDTNGDNLLSKTELMRVANASQLTNIFNTLDTDGDGQISRLEAIKGSTASTDSRVATSNSAYLSNISAGSTVMVGTQLPKLDTIVQQLGSSHVQHTATASGVGTMISFLTTISSYLYTVQAYAASDNLRLEAIRQNLATANTQRLAYPNFFSASLPGYAMGTNNATPGLHWVGERGPELMNFRGGEQVIPNDVSMRMARGGNDNSTAAAAETRALRSDVKRLENTIARLLANGNAINAEGHGRTAESMDRMAQPLETQARLAKARKARAA